MIYIVAAATAFNLVCTGTVSKIASDVEKKPYRAEYRIDLDAGKWCDGECKAPHDFAEISPVRLTLEDQNKVETTGPTRRLNFVDRETGNHRANVTKMKT